MKKFILDFSLAEKLPEWWPRVGVAKLVARVGIHECDFDLYENDIGEDVYAMFVAALKTLSRVNENLPLGVDIETLPTGTIITVIDVGEGG